MGSVVNESDPPPVACFREPIPGVPAADSFELVDEFTLTNHNNSRVPLSMINAISAKDDSEVVSVTKDEAVTFSVPSSREATSPTGPMWSVTQTIRNEDMLTIFDTGAVKNAVTRHTVAAVGCKWTDRTDISFVNTDGIKYKPLGMCLDFPFKIGNRKFKTKVYVLDKAPFQFLLGMTFLHATGCGLFPR
jgi:predicted aspartyl protease